LKKILLAILVFVFAVNINISAAQSVDEELEQAIKSMRNFDALAFALLRFRNSKESEKLETERIERTIKAWEIIKSKKDAGITRIHQELKKIDDNGEKDDYFKICASALLWEIDGLNQAEIIGQIYKDTSSSPTFALVYNYVFYPAFFAAKTQDERALPMLLPILKDNKGTIFVAQHAMYLRWPKNIEFIWGSFGNKGIPALMNILETSDNPVEIAAASGFLSRTQHLEALPKIRHIAQTGKDPAREWAIRGLGIFGHPADFNFLVRGLNQSLSTDEQLLYLWALIEYRDNHAIPHIIPLLKSASAKVRNEAMSALCFYMPTLEGVDAVARFASEAKEEEKAASPYINTYFNKNRNITPEAYLQLSKKERTQKVFQYHTNEKSKSKTKLTRQNFLEIVEGWKKDGRVTLKAPLTYREIFQVATVNDITLLNEVRAVLYHRLSDECLEEIKTISWMTHQLGRSRYRKE
jgi:HEAT repeat protein